MKTNEKEIKNRWKYRLGKLMGVMLAATTLGGSIDAKTLADFQTETYETSEFKNEITSEAESDKDVEATSKQNQIKQQNPLNQRRPKRKPNRPKHRK